MTKLEAALRYAHRASALDARLRFIIEAADGCGVTFVRPKQTCYWTIGRAAGLWEAGQTEGRIDARLSALLGDEIPADSRARYLELRRERIDELRSKRIEGNTIVASEPG